MKPESIRSADFDAQLRAVHQAGLRALPAPTLARLRAARLRAGRTQSAPARRWGWRLAALPALLGAALGVHLLLRPAPPMPTASAAASAPADSDPVATTMLDENPDLYLWLGSDTSLAME